MNTPEAAQVAACAFDASVLFDQNMADASSCGSDSLLPPRRSVIHNEGNVATKRAAILGHRADWLDSAKQRLDYLQLLRDNWDGNGAEGPSVVALENARDTIVALADIDLRPRDIDASIEGGICISFRNGSKYADIECFNTGETLAVTSSAGIDTKVWSIDNSSVADELQRIRNFTGV